jgi:hypothetical protein
MRHSNRSLLLFVFMSLICISIPGIAPAQEGGVPPCCFFEPEAAPEELPAIETIPVMDLAQEGGVPPCCFVEPEAAPV